MRYKTEFFVGYEVAATYSVTYNLSRGDDVFIYSYNVDYITPKDEVFKLNLPGSSLRNPRQKLFINYFFSRYWL